MGKEVNLGAKLIDGSLAGMTGVLSTFPLDLAKTRMQNECVPLNGTKVYRNPFQTVLLVARTEGVRGCYSGMSVNFGMISFEKSIKLVANDFFRGKLTDSNNHISISNEILAGACAGILQTTVTTPMELLKIKGQSGGNVGEVLKSIIKTEGVRGFYRGQCSTLIRDVPFSMLYFPAYSNLKKLELLGGGNWWNMASGMLAGMAAGGLSTPTDVIKTRLQTQAEGSTQSWLSCTSSIMKNEGPGAFWKGVAPRMICLGSLFSVAQVFYELQFGSLVFKDHN